jgi:hypothetical protein
MFSSLNTGITHLALLIPFLKTRDAWSSFKEQMQILWGKWELVPKEVIGLN